MIREGVSSGKSRPVVSAHTVPLIQNEGAEEGINSEMP
jgi:hypothetical protein